MPGIGCGANVAMVGGRREQLSDIAGYAAHWDLDHATVTGGILTAITDRARGATITIVGSPAVVTIDGQQYVRLDGLDDVLWIADAAALDGATGVTFVFKHANTESLPVAATWMMKGKQGVHRNGGVSGDTSAGTRFSARFQSAEVADVGPLAEFTSPAETVAIALESGVATRRVDGDGTYASTATAATIGVGSGPLSWGAIDSGTGFLRFAQIDMRAAAYFNVPLGQTDLEKAQRILERT